MTASKRVLGRIRLSRVTEESTSAERQRELIEAWAQTHGHEVVGWAEDLDVSGSVDPFATPELGAWLGDEKKHDWDILCSWKLDRISRRAIPMGKLFGWLQENEKTLVCTSDSIDLSTPMGRLIAYVIATIAEGELEAIQERNRESRRKLLSLGRWPGGKPPYGYLARERTDGAGWELALDPPAAAVVREMVGRMLGGDALNAIAADLTARGVLSPSDRIRQRAGKPAKGSPWVGYRIGYILRSKALLGHLTADGNTVRDADGQPTLVGPPLIELDLFNRLQAVLEARSVVSSTRTRKTSPLLGVVRCARCRSNMHHLAVTGSDYRYYQCRDKSHPSNSANAAEVERRTEELFLETYGHQQIRERVYVPAEDHQTQLDEALQAVDELTALLASVASETVRQRLTGQLRALDARIVELEQLPKSEARWEWRELPETYAEVWEAADTEQRRQLLMKRQVSIDIWSPQRPDSRHRLITESRLYAMDVDPEQQARAEATAATNRAAWGIEGEEAE